MKNSIFAYFAIIGTVIGSGFISGKEIVVFFSRFGIFSFPCIILSFFILFFLFKFILNKGEKALNKLKNSKISFFINIFLCLIFSSAMFAGIGNILKLEIKIINYLLFFIVIFLCFFVFKKGINGLNKLNFILVPFMTCVFLFALILNIKFQPLSFKNLFGGLSFFYCILYCVMNTANGGVMIAEFSSKLSSKQKTQVAFFSALTLSVLLLIANFVLLQNLNSFDEAMPILSLFSGIGNIIMTIMIFIGCLTTLLTLTYTLSSSMRGLCKNEFFNFFISILLPLISSLLGFNFIVEYLYPLASILGLYILFDLFFQPSIVFLLKKIKKKFTRVDRIQ